MQVWYSLILMVVFVGFGGVAGAAIGRLLMELVVKAIAFIPRSGAFILRLFGYAAGGAAGAWIALVTVRSAAMGPDGAYPLMSNPLVWFSFVAATSGCLWAALRFKRRYD